MLHYLLAQLPTFLLILAKENIFWWGVWSNFVYAWYGLIQCLFEAIIAFPHLLPMLTQNFQTNIPNKGKKLFAFFSFRLTTSIIVCFWCLLMKLAHLVISSCDNCLNRWHKLHRYKRQGRKFNWCWSLKGCIKLCRCKQGKISKRCHASQMQVRQFNDSSMTPQEYVSPLNNFNYHSSETQ